MRRKATAVMILGLTLAAAPRAFAQQSDLIPRSELRNNLRRMQDDMRGAFFSREFASRIRAEARANARLARDEALKSARIERDMARAMRMDRLRDMSRFRVPRIRVEPRVRVRRHYRDI